VTAWFLNFDFGGRSRRAHTWANYFTWLGVILALVTFGGLISAGPSGDTFGPGGVLIGCLIVVAWVAALVDGMAMIFRRAHDTGRSGWIWVLLLIPLINLLPLYWLLIQDSDAGANKYGPPVKLFYLPSAN
jgi:uncharacterized membrane protein YhaH (DUF805 family)